MSLLMAPGPLQNRVFTMRRLAQIGLSHSFTSSGANRLAGFQQQRFFVAAASSVPQTFKTDIAKRQHEDHSLPGRYATALFRVCVQKDILEDVWSDFESLRTCLSDSKNFKLFLETPGINVVQKVDMINVMSKQFKLTDTTTNFLNLLLENRRLGHLKKMIDAFENFYRAFRGEIKCLVTSASILSEDERSRVAEALKKRNSRNRLMISYSVSPSLLGGLVVRLGDQTLDYSVASRIAGLQSELLLPFIAQ